MINYRILEVKFFIECLKSMSSINDETIFQFGNGIKATLLDPSRVATADFKIGTDILEIIQDEEIRTGMNLFDLQKVMARFGKNPDEMFFGFDTKTNKFKIKANLEGKTKTFTLNSIDIDYKDYNTDFLFKIPLESIFKIKTFDFLDAMKDCTIHSDVFQIKSAYNKGITISSISQYGDCTVDLDVKKVIMDSIGTYSIKFIETILKDIPEADLIVMFQKDKPLAIHLKYSKQSYLRYMVAPRVDNNDLDEDDF